jgi:hypothetical protein
MVHRGRKILAKSLNKKSENFEQKKSEKCPSLRLILGY